MIRVIYQVRPYLSFFHQQFIRKAASNKILFFRSFCSGSTPNGEVRVKFETLRSMDPETLEIDGHISQHSIHHLDLFSNKQPADAIILKTDHLQPTQKQQQQQTMVMEIDANNIKHEQSEDF